MSNLIPHENKPSAHDEHNNIPLYIENQRQAAAIRVKLKRQQEDANTMKALELEIEKKKEFKELMEQKAEALRLKTEERVQELKVRFHYVIIYW